MTAARSCLLFLAVAPILVARADVALTAGWQQSNADIVAIDLAGRQTNLTHDPAFDVNPAVARDGKIVFLSTRDGDPDLYVMDGKGRNVHRLTNSALDHSGIAAVDDLEFSQASWSPNGKTIAFDGKYLASGPPASSTARAGTCSRSARTGAGSGGSRSAAGRPPGRRTAGASRTRAASTRTSGRKV